MGLLAVLVTWFPVWGDNLTQLKVVAVEYADAGGGRVRAREWAAPAYIHYWYTPGHWVEWEFDCTQPGGYAMFLTYAARLTTARKIEVNGRTVTETGCYILEKTGSWEMFKEVHLAGIFELCAGKNRVRITCLDEVSLCLGRIRFASPGREDISVDAVNFVAQGGGTIETVLDARAGFFTHWDRPGHCLCWEIDVPEQGDYGVVLTCASIRDAVRMVKVNGNVVDGMERVKLGGSGGWRYWADRALPAPVSLRKGKNKLCLANVEGSLNLSAIRLTKEQGIQLTVRASDFIDETGAQSPVRIHGAPHNTLTLSDWNNPGQWVEWKVHAPVAGEYWFSLRGLFWYGATFSLQVNGTTAWGYEGMSCSGGLESDNWCTAHFAVPVVLREGENRVRLTLLEGKWEVDELIFTRKEFSR